MTSTAPAILGLILRVADPGVSDFSRLPVLGCEGPCRETVSVLTGESVHEDFHAWRISWEGWTRRELRLEALERWVTISTAIENVLADPPAAWETSWSRTALARGLVTIGRHESAFWRSVGTGRLRGAAGELCYVQIHPINLTHLGVSADTLVGLDLASTEACFRAGAELLGRATSHCGIEPIEGGRRWDGGVAWFSEAIVAYGRGSGCSTDEKWAAARVAMFGRLVKHGPVPLSIDPLLALEFMERGS